MRAALKIIITLVLIPSAVTLGVEVAKPILPDVLPAAVQSFAMLAEWAGFPWVFAGCVGLLLGLWLDRLAAAFDGRHPMTRRGKLMAISSEVERIGALCHQASRSELTSDRREANRASAEAAILQKKLAEIGLAIPNLNPRLTQRERLEAFANVFGAIGPALRGGEIEFARATAATIALTSAAHLSDERRADLDY